MSQNRHFAIFYDIYSGTKLRLSFSPAPRVDTHKKKYARAKTGVSFASA